MGGFRMWSFVCCLEPATARALPSSAKSVGCYPIAGERHVATSDSRAFPSFAEQSPRKVFAFGDSGRLRHRRATEQGRSEEHTSELQSLRHLVCRLLLEKKKTKWTTTDRRRRPWHRSLPGALDAAR